MSDELHETIGHIRGTLDSNTNILRDIKDWMERHEEKDDRRFSELGSKVDKVNAKVIYGSGVISALVSIFLPWLKGH